MSVQLACILEKSEEDFKSHQYNNIFSLYRYFPFEKWCDPPFEPNCTPLIQAYFVTNYVKINHLALEKKKLKLLFINVLPLFCYHVLLENGYGHYLQGKVCVRFS